MTPRAVLFDCFGTLVTYSPSRTVQGYPRASAVLGRTEAKWLDAWDRASDALEAEARQTLAEYSMGDCFAAFVAATGVDPACGDVFCATYVEEWCSAVAPIAGVPPMLDDLRAAGLRLAVVSNTHDPALVPRLLTDHGIVDHFDAVVLSIDVGRRKPHPAIYDAALAALGVSAGEAVFVGDDRVADHDGPLAHGMRPLLIGDQITSVLDVPARLDHHEW